MTFLVHGLKQASVCHGHERGDHRSHHGHDEDRDGLVQEQNQDRKFITGMMDYHKHHHKCDGGRDNLVRKQNPSFKLVTSMMNLSRAPLWE